MRRVDRHRGSPTGASHATFPVRMLGATQWPVGATIRAAIISAVEDDSVQPHIFCFQRLNHGSHLSICGVQHPTKHVASPVLRSLVRRVYLREGGRGGGGQGSANQEAEEAKMDTSSMDISSHFATVSKRRAAWRHLLLGRILPASQEQVRQTAVHCMFRSLDLAGSSHSTEGQ